MEIFQTMILTNPKQNTGRIKELPVHYTGHLKKSLKMSAAT